MDRPRDIPPVTLDAAIRGAARRLAASGADTPRLDAEVLLRRVLGLDRAALFARLRDPLPPDARRAFEALVERRAEGEPVAYLVGEREFMALPFAVGPGALVPRPETELLVEWALDWLANRPRAVALDVGTGSGAIALALAAHLPAEWSGRIVAADRSAAALAWAARNRAVLDGAGRVRLVRGDLAEWCAPGAVDLLLANLPYLTPGQIAENPDLAAEPRAALDGGPDGLDLVRRLLADAPRILAPGGAFGLELDPSQTEPVAALARHAFPDARVRVIADLSGRPRHVVAER